MDKARLSIMAPCYNGEAYIARFLDSVLSQTHDNIQLVLVNDGSSDNTEEIIVSYEEKFKQRGYEYIHLNQQNKGIGGALNDALKYVNGDYLTWFGTDDFAVETYAEELVGFLEDHQEFAVVRNDGFLVTEDNLDKPIGRMADGNNDKHNPHLFENAVLERNFHFGYSVIRMSAFDAVNPEREIYPSREGQNWQLLLPVFYHYKAAFYDKPLYYVIYDDNSVSRISHKSYERVKAQNEEYEKILNTVISKMDIPDKDKYLKTVEIKYVKRRLLAAANFNQNNDVISEYKKLKEYGKPDKISRRQYLLAKFPIIKKLKRIFK